MHFIIINMILSLLASGLVVHSIPKLSQLFISAGLFGRDLCKANKSIKVPESQGLVCGTIFLVTLFAFMGIRFGKHFVLNESFPHLLFSQFLTALLSICCMVLLGFADDVLNLKWRYKLFLPTIASIPLLMVYYINEGSTTIIVPKPFRIWCGLSLNIGPLYYIFMSLLAVFCTNAINIYAGINGLESGQACIIAFSVAIFNFIELNGFQREENLFSLFFMLPFAAISAALYYYNRYPAKVFVGDTFTYFAGMTFAVVGIIGHFSKTLLLFFIPQLINFIYSIPQLFKVVSCPRHRLPRYNEQNDYLEFSEVCLNKKELRVPVLPVLRILHYLKLVNLREDKNSQTKKGETDLCYLNNLTLINLILVWFGPLKEGALTRKLLLLQILSSCIALLIRYPLSKLFYD